MKSFRKQFFRQAPVRAAVARLSNEPRITLVVGAGASAEVGLPLWNELVRRLLLRALSPKTPPASTDYPASAIEATARLLQEKGTLEAATMARAALGSKFPEALRLCLYEWPHKWRWNQPGETARAVARLYECQGRSKSGPLLPVEKWSTRFVSRSRSGWHRSRLRSRARRARWSRRGCDHGRR